MSLLGKTIKLKGLSQKGRNRVRELGDVWTVLAETDRVLFAANQPGAWLFVAPKNHDANSRASRWIRAQGDSDFEVMILQDD